MVSRFHIINPFYHIFRVEYIQLAAEYKPAVNLGQGFPDYHAPEHVLKALSRVALGENPLANQYTRGFVSLFLNISGYKHLFKCNNNFRHSYTTV